jgi:hypothetical protein
MIPHPARLIALLWVGAIVVLDGAPAATQVPAVDLREFWSEPADLETRDFFLGPWGAEHAPDPDDVYRFIEDKKGGINPGMTVRDSRGWEWKVKQPPNTGRNAEGPIEVVLSRILSGIGYHQPPVYFLPAIQMTDGKTRYQAAGGRLRLDLPGLKAEGDWEWRDNPFVGTRPHHGLLVVLLMFNSSDLKDSNNTLYEDRRLGATIRRWYVVRDLGTALGSTARLAPIRGDPAVFETLGFIRGIANGLVEFHYNGRHQPLVQRRVQPGDVRWAAALLARLSDAQWDDAFRAGGYPPDIRRRFIVKLKAKITEGLALTGTD